MKFKKTKKITRDKLEISAPITQPTHIGASTGDTINLSSISRVPKPSFNVLPGSGSSVYSQPVAPSPRPSYGNPQYAPSLYSHASQSFIPFSH